MSDLDTQICETTSHNQPGPKRGIHSEINGELVLKPLHPTHFLDVSIESRNVLHEYSNNSWKRYTEIQHDRPDMNEKIGFSRKTIGNACRPPLREVGIWYTSFSLPIHRVSPYLRDFQESLFLVLFVTFQGSPVPRT